LGKIAENCDHSIDPREQFMKMDFRAYEKIRAKLLKVGA
jgi:hypothetical protein